MIDPQTAQNTALQAATAEFLEAINSFAWKADYIKFCEVLGFSQDSYSEEKYQQFRELISYLNCFDAESIAKILAAGGLPK
ncbi:hypothetical protein H6G64_35460 [Calothrix sp. FACHB-156]|nr:hypothetical protein [Calothrix sp. FACHB-156]